MPILDILQLVLSIFVTVMPTILAALKEKHDVKRSAFELGLDELHAADERMRVEGHQQQPSTVQPN